MIIDGIFALEICNEMVPDFDTAKIDLDKTSDLIFSSEITSMFSIFFCLIISKIEFLFSSVAWK